MFFQVSNALKKRLVLIFQEIFQEHPIFNKVQVFTKFPEDERPKNALMVRSVSGSSQKLSFDNFVRTAIQFSTLANLKGIPGNSIEWVRDDELNLDKMSAPGYYIFEMLTDTSFKISPYLLVDDEQLTIEFVEGKSGAYLRNSPVNTNTEVIYSDNGIELKRDIDYTIDCPTGKIIFQTSITEFEKLFIDYQVIDTPTDEIPVQAYTLNDKAIPGVILAFGDRLRAGDQQVIVVEKEARDIAKVYGGRWQLSCDLIGLSQDDDQQERLVDYAVSMFWAKYQDELCNEGINVLDFSLSGESEDLEAEIAEEYFYTGGISFTAEVDWELHVPLIAEVRRISIAYGYEGFRNTITDSQESGYVESQFDKRMVGTGYGGIEIVNNLEPYVLRPTPITVRTLRYPT